MIGAQVFLWGGRSGGKLDAGTAGGGEFEPIKILGQWRWKYLDSEDENTWSVKMEILEQWGSKYLSSEDGNTWSVMMEATYDGNNSKSSVKKTNLISRWTQWFFALDLVSKNYITFF